MSLIQKDIITFDQAFRDIYQLDYYSTISSSKVLKQNKGYSSQLIYQEIKNLEKYKILKKYIKEMILTFYWIWFNKLNIVSLLKIFIVKMQQYKLSHQKNSNCQ